MDLAVTSLIEAYHGANPASRSAIDSLEIAVLSMPLHHFGLLGPLCVFMLYI